MVEAISASQVYYVVEETCLVNSVKAWNDCFCISLLSVMLLTLHNPPSLHPHFSLKSASAQHSQVILLRVKKTPPCFEKTEQTPE